MTSGDHIIHAHLHSGLEQLMLLRPFIGRQPVRCFELLPGRRWTTSHAGGT